MITSFYAGILSILFILLSLNVATKRVHTKVSVGHGDNEPLLKAIRMQVNFIEYVPFALLLLFLAEINGAYFFWLNINGILLFVARLMHAVGLYRTTGPSMPRFAGTNLTWFVIANLGVINIVFGLKQIF